MNAEPVDPVVEEVADPVAEEQPPEPVAEPVVEVAPADETPWFAGVDKLFSGAFTEQVDAKQYGEMLAKLTPDEIASMPPAAQAALRAAYEYSKQAVAPQVAKLDADRKKLDADRAAAKAESERITREGAQLNALLTSPEIRRLRETKPPAKADLSSPEGQKAYFDAMVGQKINEAFAPVLDRATALSHQAAWLDLQARMPEFKDSRALPEFEGRSFLKEVEARQEAQEKAGRPVTDTETMGLVVAGELARKREQTRIANERAARAQAATNIQRTQAAGAQRPKAPPPDVIRRGALAEWMRANPDYRPEA